MSAPNHTIPIRSSLFANPWTRLDRYIFSEIHAPFWMAMLVYNGILFIRAIGDVTEIGSGRFDLPFNLFLTFFIAEIPGILLVTIPMSFLLAGLTAVGRMSADSEIIAPQTVGLSFWRLSRPVLVYGLLLSALLLLLANWAGPRLQRLKLIRYQNFLENIALPKFQPGVINSVGDGAVFYVDHLDQNQMADLLIIDGDAQKEDIWLAQRATIHADRNLGLFDAVNIKLDKQTSKVNTISASYIRQPLPGVKKMSEDRVHGDHWDRLTTLELLARTKQQSDGPTLLEYEITIWERFFGPWLSSVFAFFVIPLAGGHSRMRKGSGFGLSLLILVLFFIVARVFKNAAVAGHMPVILGMGLPTLLFLLVGLALQIGKNTWASQTWARWTDFVAIWRGRLWRRIKRLRPSKRRAPQRSQEDLNSSGRPPSAWQFPRRLDKYVTRYFFSTFMLVQGSVLMLFLLIEYTQIARYAQKNQIDGAIVFKYLIYKTPEMLVLTLFFCLLIATLIVFAVMSKNMEVTAIRAGGGSLQRLCLPLMVIGLAASGFTFYFSNSILPNTNRSWASLKNLIKNRQDALFTKDVWIKNGPGEILNYRAFDPAGNRLVGVHLYRFGDQNAGTIVERLEIPSLIFRDGWQSEFGGKGRRFFRDPEEQGLIKAEISRVQADTEVDLNIALEDLVQKKRSAAEFSIAELGDHLNYLRGLGISESHFQTEFYAKWAQPTLPFLMMLLAMPLGFQFGRRGTFYGIGIGLILGLAFWGLFEFTKQMGSAGTLHPIVAAWSPVAMFGFWAAYRFLNLE